MSLRIKRTSRKLVVSISSVFCVSIFVFTIFEVNLFLAHSESPIYQNNEVWDLKLREDIHETHEVPIIRRVSDFTRFLLQPTGFCKRLAMIGGPCNNRDGAKRVCLDDKFISRNDCLIHSFGVGGDISFEVDFIRFQNKCEIHLFDIHEKEKISAKHVIDSRWQLNYHMMGLHSKTMIVPKREAGEGNITVTVPLATYEHILSLLNQQNRPIFLLKIDIEGLEWDVLDELLDKMSSSDVLKNVQQLALELHLKHLLDDISKMSWTSILQRKMNLLSRLESEAGFRRVYFEENHHINCAIFVPNENRRVQLCGEILYIKEDI